jgi:hypothetical protein
VEDPMVGGSPMKQDGAVAPSSRWHHGRPAVELTLTLRCPNLDENRSYAIFAGWEAQLKGS